MLPQISRRLYRAFVLVALAAIPSLACPGGRQQSNSDKTAQEQTTARPDLSDCQGVGEGDPGRRLVDLCEFALTFRHQLPDFVCEQTTTTSHSKATMNAEVTFEKGHEHYSDLTVDGKAVKENWSMRKAMDFVSTGELGSNLVDLFRLPRAPEFRFRKEEKFGHTPALLYDFYIAAERNRYWALHDSRGMTVYPEYKGQIWIDRNSGRPLRLAFRAVNLPTDFDFREAMISIDYNDVAIAGAGAFLLPSRSTTKACLQHVRPADTKCRTNTLVFHDCRKFGTESHILSDKPQD